MSDWNTPVRRRAALALTLLLSGSVLARVTTPTKHLADLHPPVDLEAIFPKTFGGWRVDPSVTHGCPWSAGAAAVRARLAALPEDPIDAVAVMLDDLAGYVVARIN